MIHKTNVSTHKIVSILKSKNVLYVFSIQILIINVNKQLKNTINQIILSSGFISISVIILYFLKPQTDYPIVALLLLFIVGIFAVTLNIIPVILASTLSALLLNFLFIPPLYTLHIANSNDILLFLIFFIVSIINAILTNRIRKAEAEARDKAEKVKTIELYNTVLNSLSHELRTPLSTISACIDTLLFTPGNLSIQQQYVLLNQIQIANNRLNRQVDNLLNMSRLESGILKLKTNWCDINEMVLSIINISRETSTKNIIYHEDTSLPLVLIDDDLINQILSNLVNNAIIHTSEETEIIIKVSIKSEMNLVIQVIDTGLGLPDEELPKLFDKFYRVPNSVKGGTGLGLSIVKGYILALNGTIEVEKNQPQGLIFKVELPIKTSYLNKLRNE